MARPPYLSGFAAAGAALAVAALGSLFAAWPTAGAGLPPHNQQIRQLREERLATLGRIVELIERRQRSGSASMAELAAARRDIAEAELQMCATLGERVRVLEKMVATATLLEAQAERLAAQGAASEEAWLKTRADVLQLRIRLQEARSKAVGELGGCDDNPPLLNYPR